MNDACKPPSVWSRFSRRTQRDLRGLSVEKPLTQRARTTAAEIAAGFAKCLPLACVLLVGIQFVPVDNRNPPIQSANTIYSIEAVPRNVRAIFDSSCSNCHSNQTRWPWYSHVAPFSWIVVHDVHRGRSLMNFSEWGSYSPKKRDQKLEDICDQLMNGDMPDGKYLLIHRHARLSQEQREAVCQWTQAPR